MAEVSSTGHTSAVKTAISLPDDLYLRAERLAQRLGRTRSALYAEALAAYVNALEAEDEVTRVLDELYAHESDPAPRAPGASAGRLLVDRGEWEW